MLFLGPHSTRAVISEASREFGIDLDIAAGRIDSIAGEPFGVMALAAYGQAEALEAAFAWMRGLGLVIEEIAP